MRRILAVVLVLNLAVAVAKLAVGWMIDSISMLADGFHSLTDSASNVVGLVGISLAAQPPDDDHPYGHRKLETLSALFIGGLLAMTAWEVLQSCVERLYTGSVPEVTAASFAVMGITIVVNLAVSTYEGRRGEALHSEVLAADAAHTRSDVFVSLGVIASLLAARWGYPQMDVVAALAITAVIGRVAYSILRRSAGLLADVAVVPAERIHDIALAVSGVESVHKIRTRGLPHSGHADLHIQVRPELRIDQAHAIGHRVADRLRRELGLLDVVTHVEPADDRSLNKLDQPIEAKLLKYFEWASREQPDVHWQNGVELCRRWSELKTRKSVSQPEIDRFLERLEGEPSAGTGWIELDLQFRHWAREQGYRA